MVLVEEGDEIQEEVECAGVVTTAALVSKRPVPTTTINKRDVSGVNRLIIFRLGSNAQYLKQQNTISLSKNIHLVPQDQLETHYLLALIKLLQF